MRKILKWRYGLGIVLFAVFMLPSCVKESVEIPEPGNGSDEATITLSMRLPGNSVATRALTDADEYEVKTVEVLVFDRATQKYKYTAYANQINPGTGGTNTRSFTVKLIAGGPVDLVLLANSREWISGSYTGAIPVGELKADVQKTLAAEITGKWNTDNTDIGAYRAIPMWGEAENITVDASLMATGINGINMTRMVSRIDVSLSATAQTMFKLKDVRLYNYNTRGLVIPDTDDNTKWNTSLEKAVGASLPANPGKADTPTPEANSLLYDVMTTADKACAAEIYTFEAAAGSTTNYLENTCLVIGGDYSDDGGTTWTTCYYRVDFATTSGLTTTYMPLKRNHRYMVEVSKVTGLGYPEPDEAFRALPVNIEIGILEWNESDMENVWFDGIYYYSITPLDTELWAQAYTASAISFKTDYSTWSFELSDLPTPNDPAKNLANIDWLDITSHTPDTEYAGIPTGDDILYNVTLNTSGGNRVAYLHYTSGRFKVTGTITQTMRGLTSIVISPSGQDIPAEGAVRTITATGDYGDIMVIAKDKDTDEIFAAATIPASTTGSSANITIPQYWFADDPTVMTTRDVIFQYLPSGATQFIDLEIQQQESCWIQIAIYDNTTFSPTLGALHNGGDEINSYHGEYKVIIWGSIPSILLRAAVDGSDDISESGTTYITQGTYTQSDPATGQIIFNGNTTGFNRVVHLQYTSDGGIIWHDISTGPQSRFADPYTGRIFAINDALLYGDSGVEKMTWAEAMGIPMNFNSEQFWGTANGGTTNDNIDYIATEPTGCNAYWEVSPSDPKLGRGNWRVMTHEGVQFIQYILNAAKVPDMGDAITNTGGTGYATWLTGERGLNFSGAAECMWWEHNTPGAYYYAAYNSSAAWDKSNAKRVRCVANP